jgi:hypothetical protein
VNDDSFSTGKKKLKKKRQEVFMPAATPTSAHHDDLVGSISNCAQTTFARCEDLQQRITRARFWLSVLALLSLLDAPAMLIQSALVTFAYFYSMVLAVLAFPLVCYVNWCKTVQFAEQHRVGTLRLSLNGVGILSVLRRSVHRNELIAELVVWFVFAPPYIRDIWPWTKLLDLCCFARIYALLLYYGSQHYSSRVSCVALARLFHRHINLHFVLASTLFARPGVFLFALISVFWSLCTLLFSRLEGRSLGDSFYFVWVSCALIGYGDVYPHTFGGQVVAMMCGAFSWLVVGFAMQPFSSSSAGFRPRENLYLITLAALLIMRRREAAAAVVVWTLRHARARRRLRHPVIGKQLASKIAMQHTAAMHHYMVLYDEMIAHVETTKFLEVFTTERNVKNANLLQNRIATPSSASGEQTRQKVPALRESPCTPTDEQAAVVADVREDAVLDMGRIERIEAKVTYLVELFQQLSDA